MKSLPSKNYFGFALLAALLLSSFALPGCQPPPPLQMEPANPRASLEATATVTAEEVSADAPTRAATVSPTPTFTERPTAPPTLSSLSCFHLSYPENGTTISGTSTIEFRWDTQPGAQLYILTVFYPYPDQSRTDVPTNNTNVLVSLNTASKTATYAWSVKAFDINGNAICNSTLFSFTKIEEVSNLDPVTPPTVVISGPTPVTPQPNTQPPTAVAPQPSQPCYNCPTFVGPTPQPPMPTMTNTPIARHTAIAPRPGAPGP